MRDDQNNNMPTLSSNPNQQPQDFYVDSSDPYLSQEPNKKDFFEKQTDSSNDFGAPTFASSKKPILIVLGVLFGIVAIFFFMPAEKTVQQVQKEEKAKIEEKKVVAEKNTISIPKSEDVPKAIELPTPKPLAPPPLITPKPPEPPPAPIPASPVAPAFPTDGSTPSLTPAFPTVAPQASTGSIFSSKEEEEAKKRALQDRRKSAIMVKGSGESTPSSKDGQGKDGATTPPDGKEQKPAQKASTDGFLGFGDGTLNEQVLKKTSSAQVSATYLGRLDSTIAQGKIINAVLETAVNSDLPGTLRAIVSRDVYAESGKAVLIPKGSRLIGTYSVELKPGQTRISVAWNRLIRPDGIDLALNSPGTDTLGRAGVAGFLDDKTLTKLASAFMISYIIPTITNKISNVNDKGITQTQTKATDGSTTTTTAGGTVGSSQLKESSDKFQDIAQKAIEDSLNTKATIYVDQGARINVFVNQDIVFPPQIAMNSLAKVVR